MNSDEESLTPMVGSDPFERLLLSAGRGDISSPDVDQEWGRFVGRMAFVAGAIEPISGVHHVSDSMTFGTAPSSVTPSPTIVPIGKAASGMGGALLGLSAAKAYVGPLAAKALAVALLGGGLIAGGLWLKSKVESSEDVASRTSIALPGPSTVASLPPEPSSSKGLDVSSPDEEGRKEVSAPGQGIQELHLQAAEKRVPVKSKTLPKVSNSERPEPGFGGVLTGQIMLLDEARVAPAARAVHLIDEFHRRYPHGALRADAELVALQALRTMEQTTDLELRGKDFLRRYPRDPHSSKVHDWLGEVGRD